MNAAELKAELKKKKDFALAESAMCKVGAICAAVGTVCQVAHTVECVAFWDTAAALTMALACGLGALALWSYGAGLDEDAREIEAALEKMRRTAQVKEMCRAAHKMKPGTYMYWEKNCG